MATCIPHWSIPTLAFRFHDGVGWSKIESKMFIFTSPNTNEF